ncbi:MAG: 5-(carboxyamino)imidazole ribonucleotide synthase [Candidatus Ancillula sp.]|jgi:5-(carboxyamino)imidazole ribonucleotide synthase|nr:5-(carboxyamino)imidazole ribonucleotide synthase [Candidatus Ancillula sp.]
MRVAIVGGGQLARMMAPCFEELGIDARVLVEAIGVSADQVYQDTVVGAAGSLDSVRRIVYGLDSTVLSKADVLTFEHEHVPSAIIEQISSEGFKVFPSSDALQYAQDKLKMREKLHQEGLPCPKFARIGSERDLVKFFDVLQAKGQARDQAKEVVLKLPRGGYDGKGVEIIDTPSSKLAAKWLSKFDSILAEEKVDFAFEASSIVVRSSTGEIKAYDTVLSHQENGVCRYVIAPAPDLDQSLQKKAQDIAVEVATKLGVVGVLAVEMFFTKTGEFLINELAMRPHNTGHWTINGAVTSQFENHIRAVLGLKLGSTSRINPEHFTVMANILGSKRGQLSEAIPAALAHNSCAKINLYGKEIREGRKLGHVNISGKDARRLLEDALWIATLFEGKH